MQNKRLMMLDMGAFSSWRTKYRGEFEDRMKKNHRRNFTKMVRSFLFIDELHTLIGAEVVRKVPSMHRIY